MADKLETEIRKHALQNAYEHGGKTKDKIVLSKVLGSMPEFRGKAGQILGQISDIVSEVNSMQIEEQKGKLEAEFPEALIPKTRAEYTLPPLHNASHGEVVTRFPPEPNGYPHIGHAKAAIINSEYARMYGGRCILRIDDTNPESERMEYHAAIKVGLDWLGVKFDAIKNTSDDMELFYEKALELIQLGKAYVCTCKREEMSRNRREKAYCRCSQEGTEESSHKWEKMFQKFKPGDAVLRFRGDMKSENAVMRDPVLFRVIDEKHYTLGKKYRVWPSYDFAVAIEDSHDDITHAFRSKEFELRRELIDSILDALGMRKPSQGFFSRLEFEGMPISKRILRPLIEQGKIPWYDDPRLPTLEALRRRGIRPEAVRKFILSLGLTKADTLAPFDALEAFNRSIIDPASIRLFMVSNPRKITVKGLPDSAEIPNHPSGELGSRKVEISQDLIIAGNDAKSLSAGSRIRLLGLGDVMITEAGVLRGELAADSDSKEIQKIQWVSESNACRLKIIVPKPPFIGEEFNEDSLEVIAAYSEPHYLELKEGSEIQFVRFGYCRKDSQTQAIFTHK